VAGNAPNFGSNDGHWHGIWHSIHPYDCPGRPRSGNDGSSPSDEEVTGCDEQLFRGGRLERDGPDVALVAGPDGLDRPDTDNRVDVVDERTAVVRLSFGRQSDSDGPFSTTAASTVQVSPPGYSDGCWTIGRWQGAPSDGWSKSIVCVIGAHSMQSTALTRTRRSTRPRQYVTITS